MDRKQGKQYLPQTYEQYLLQRKKNGKQVPTKHNTLEAKENVTNNKNVEKKEVESPRSDKSRELVITETIIHSDYKRMFDEFENNRFEAIRTRIEQELTSLQENPPIKVTPVSKLLSSLEIQSHQNIHSIREEFNKPTYKRNTESLEEMLNFNKFFIILNREKKWKIFEHAVFEEYEPGDIIYKEGDADQYMYVIIKGCVKQYETRETSFNEKMTVNFVSYYEGSNFGELQSFPEEHKRGKRHHTTEATEKCYLLRIGNQFYKDLISNSSEDDFEKKLNALMQCSIFKDSSKLIVSPLLSTLEKHHLPYGKVLIRQGEEVHKLYFIAEGTIQIMLLDRARRNIKHLNLEDKPASIYLKKPKQSKTKSYSIHHTFYYPAGTEPTKEFLYGQKRLVGDQIEYNDQVLFAELRVGDFFGGKSFLSINDRQKKEANSKYFDLGLNAKLSVLSSATQTTVYSIDEKKYFSLSDTMQKLIGQGILDHPYFDEYDIEEKATNQRDWKQFSEKLVEQVIRSKKEKSHSFRN